MHNSNRIVLFGGTGFIGTHLAQHWLRREPALRIVLVDLNPPRTAPYAALLQAGLESGRVQFMRCDVRQPIPEHLVPAAEIVFNLAAVHREPGHQPYEYFETNLQGAENICNWAAATGCSRMVFTSSISPYGPSEDLKNEFSLPVPETAYGSSKLVSEKIHLAWQAARPGRQLLIVRPGVVFGPGEGGNVTRLVRSLMRGYFVYMGNRETRKAAGYVKELCHVIDFGLDVLNREGRPSLLLNFTLDPAPTMEQFVSVIQEAAKRKRPVPSLPRPLLVGSSYPVAAMATFLGITQPINPVRVRKLFRSTNIEPYLLRQLGYKYKYTLESAFRDWIADSPGDFVYADPQQRSNSVNQVHCPGQHSK